MKQQQQMQIQSPEPPSQNLQRSPVQQQQETKVQQPQSQSEPKSKPQKKNYINNQNKDLSFFKEETEEEVKQNYNEVIEMEKNDLEKIQIIIKSYLMLNYRNNYLKDKNDKPDLQKGLSNADSIPDVDYQDENRIYSNPIESTTEISDFMNKTKDDFQSKSPHLSTFRNLANALITKKFIFNKPNDDDQLDFLNVDYDSSSDYNEEVIEDFNTNSFKSGEENIKKNNHIRFASNDEKFISENEDENKNKSNTDNKINIIESPSNDENSDSDNKSAVADDEKSNSNSADQSDEDESKTLKSDNENSDSDESKSSNKNDTKSKSSNANNVNENTESSTKNNNSTDDDDSNYYENDQLSNSSDDNSSVDDASSILGMKLINYIQKEIDEKSDIYDMILKLVIKKVLKKDKKDILSNFLAQSYKLGGLHYVFIIIYNINCKLPFEKKEFLDDFAGTCFIDDRIIRFIINSLNEEPKNIPLYEINSGFL